MKEKKKNIIIVICIVSIILSVCAFIYIFYANKYPEFIYTDHLEEQVMSVEALGTGQNVEISLKEMTYYIINVEGNIHQMALQYNSNNPEAYWLVRVEATYNMKDYAKDWAFDSCVRDNIYYLEALKHNMELTQEELEMAAEDARTIMKNITSKQMNVSEFTVDMLYDLEKKLYLSAKYANKLVDSGYSMEELELEGAYYKKLLSQYKVETNDNLWDKVKLGNLTIDNKPVE